MDLSPKPTHISESPRNAIKFMAGLLSGISGFLVVNFLGTVTDSILLTFLSYIVLGSTLVGLILWQRMVRKPDTCDICGQQKGKENLEEVIMEEPDGDLHTFDACDNCQVEKSSEIIPESTLNWDWRQLRFTKHG